MQMLESPHFSNCAPPKPSPLNLEARGVNSGLPVMGGIRHKMALGGNPHFFVLINGMSFVRVGVRTESIKAYILTVCGLFCCIPLHMMVG